MKRNGENIKLFLRINRLLFLITIIIYLLLIVINQLGNKLFKEYLNINIIFIFLLISGMSFLLPIINERDMASKKRNLERVDIFSFIIMGIICSLLVLIKIKNFGAISYIISVITGLIILSLPILLFHD